MTKAPRSEVHVPEHFQNDSKLIRECCLVAFDSLGIGTSSYVVERVVFEAGLMEAGYVFSDIVRKDTINRSDSLS